MMKAHRLAALAALVLVGSVTPANAIPVTYSTRGVFDSSGNANFNQGGIQVRFNPITGLTVNPPPSTNTSFGSFEIIGITPILPPGTTLSDRFTLFIDQTAPGIGSVNFPTLAAPLGVTGTIFLGNSQAFVQFADPLIKTITAGGITTFYRIDEADEGVAGRVKLPGNPGQTTSVDGEVGIVPIPEPGTMALACAALPLLGLGYVRRRRQMAKV